MLGFVNLDYPKWEYDKFNKYPDNQVTRKSEIIKGDIKSICNALDGKHLFYNIGAKIAVLNIFEKKISNIMEFQKENIHSMIYLDKFKALVYSTDFNLHMINPYDSSINFSLKIGITIENLITCFSNLQNKIFIIGSNKNEVIYFDVEKKNEIQKIKSFTFPSKIIKLFYCNDKNTFGIGLEDSCYWLQNIDSGELRKKNLTRNSNGCYLGEGKTIIFITKEGNIDIFNKLNFINY